MPWTIYRYAIIEMLKLMLAATFSLTIIISFAAAIKPLSEGLLDGLGVLRFILFTAPMMLQFSLPFATVFASTLLYNRMASDNEVLALTSCGIGYKLIILPAVFLGLSLTIVMFLLSNAIVPTLFGQATRMIKQDFLTMVVRQVSQQQAVKLGDWWVYADRADASQKPPTAENGPQPVRMIVLEGVAIGKVTQADTPVAEAGQRRQGEMSQESTAARAIILMYESQGQSWVTMRLEKAMTLGAFRGSQANSSSGAGAGKGQLESIDIFRQPLPNRFRDQPKYKSWFELVQISRQPEHIPRIAQEKRELAYALAMADVRSQLAMNISDSSDASGQTSGAVKPMYFENQTASYQVISPNVQIGENGLILMSDTQSPVVIEVTPKTPELARRTIICQKAVLKLRKPELGEIDSDHQSVHSVSPVVTLSLFDVRVFSEQDDIENELKIWALPPMYWRPETALISSAESADFNNWDHYLSADVWSLLRFAKHRSKTLKEQGKLAPSDHQKLIVIHDRLAYMVRRMMHRVLAQFNLRTAHAISCCLTLLLGALLSLRLRDKMPLVVFFWSFLISVGVLITLLGGESLTKQGKNDWWIGVLVNWTGTALLGGYLLLLYRRICRN